MSIINRRDAISSGNATLAVSNHVSNKRPLGFALAATILSLTGAIYAQAKQHVWVDEEVTSDYAAVFVMPAAGNPTMKPITPAHGCTRDKVRGCLSDDFDSMIEVYIFSLPLKHGGPR